jgi:hypothetical protein
MTYIIYNNINLNFYKIAENDSDLSSLNLPEGQYLAVQASQEDFDAVKLSLKYVLPYNGTSNQLTDQPLLYNKDQMINFINVFKDRITHFLNHHPQSIVFSRWQNYYNFINSVNVDAIYSAPKFLSTQTFEQYVQSTGNPFYNILQLP